MDGNLDLLGRETERETELTSLISRACLISKGWGIPRLKVSRDCARHARLIHVQLVLSDVPIGVHFLGNLQMGSSASSP